MCPIVLHHGLFGCGNIRFGPVYVPYFRGGIQRAIAERGHPIIAARVHPTAGVAQRAAQLRECIVRGLAATGDPEQQVFIVAHSMGGLDARYMISKLGMERRVRALLTISTPHRGSSFADWVLNQIGRRLGVERLVATPGLNWRALLDVSCEQCGLFNQQVPDSPAVRYFSVSAAQPRRLLPKILWPSHRIIFAAEGENDGWVSVASSTWGSHLGIWPADHFHTINNRVAKSTWVRHANITPRYLLALDAIAQAGVSFA